MPAHPHNDTHGGSVIAHNDQHDIPVYDVSPGAFISYVPDDEPADVTVSDLLDAYLDRDYYTGSPRHHDLYQRATSTVAGSYWDIRHALEASANLRHYLAVLSPEERAEFDRRTN